MQKSILIVDDNATIRKSLRFLLERSGEWTVCGEATNGRDALEKARQLHPDLVVLDFAMPVMNGFEAASVIREGEPGLPLILLTAYKDRMLERQALERGFNAVLSKGEDGNHLIQCARKLLARSVDQSLPIGNFDAELAAIEELDWNYQRNPNRRPSDVFAYITRQRRKREILAEITAQGSASKPEAHDSEARDFRTRVDTEVTVYSDRGGVLPGRAIEVSESGFSAVLPIELEVGEIVRVEINLPPEVKTGQAIVRNRNAFRHGFEFLPTSLSKRLMRFSEFS